MLATRVHGAITPVMADHVSDAISRAERGQYHALILNLDTPGGLDTSMRTIVKDILDSMVPVIVHVAPPGARAASAGVIITFAAHVAAMAPGTAIGAATPISSGGDDLNAKVTNDAAAYAESLAQLRGRSVEFAIQTVRAARSASADEALSIGAVDLIASSTDELLDQIDGRIVHVGPGSTEVLLRTAGATVDSYEMGLFRRIQQFLADPNLTFVLLSLATLGLVYELATPGLGAGAILCAAGFALAFVGLAVLPINVVGVVFLLLGSMLLVAELFSPGVGVAAASGAVMFALGGIFLVDDAPGIDVSLGVVLPMTATLAILCLVAGSLALRSRSAPSILTGVGPLIGRIGTIRTRTGQPQALIEGSWWRARSRQGSLSDGDVVRVEAVEELELIVERVESVESAETTSD